MYHDKREKDKIKLKMCYMNERSRVVIYLLETFLSLFVPLKYTEQAPPAKPGLAMPNCFG